MSVVAITTLMLCALGITRAETISVNISANAVPRNLKRKRLLSLEGPNEMPKQCRSQEKHTLLINRRGERGRHCIT